MVRLGTLVTLHTYKLVDMRFMRQWIEFEGVDGLFWTLKGNDAMVESGECLVLSGWCGCVRSALLRRCGLLRRRVRVH